MAKLAGWQWVYDNFVAKSYVDALVAGMMPQSSGVYPDGTHVDEMTAPGVWWASGSFTAANGFPWMRHYFGILTVKQSHGSGYVQQEIQSSNEMQNRWVRVSRGGVFSAWEPIGPLHGVGRPEGVVAAPQGAEYIDINATAGARKWLKVSGTGVGGWIVTEGDTGRLALSPENGWTGSLIFSCVNETVTITGTDINGSGAENVNIHSLVNTAWGSGQGTPIFGVGNPVSSAAPTPAGAPGVSLSGGTLNTILRVTNPSSWVGGGFSISWTRNPELTWPGDRPGTPI